MSAIVFKGREEAKKREEVLREQIGSLSFAPRMTSVVFAEDSSSQVYTKLKFEASIRVGVEFDRVDVSIGNSVEELQQVVASASGREDIHGVMIQKPAKQVWYEQTQKKDPLAFEQWWRMLTMKLDPMKDVDCLASVNLDRVYGGDWVVLPATVMGMVTIIKLALELMEMHRSRLTQSGGLDLRGLQAVVVGRSEIVGKPMAAVLRHYGAHTQMVGSQTQDLPKLTASADILVSATGKEKLIVGGSVKQGSIVIDVGAPKGDVDFESTSQVAGFITPVPGGVGPMTVVSLLENLLIMIGQN